MDTVKRDVTRYDPVRAAIMSNKSFECVSVTTEWVEWGLQVHVESGGRRGTTGYTWESMRHQTVERIVQSFQWYLGEFVSRYGIRQ